MVTITRIDIRGFRNIKHVELEPTAGGAFKPYRITGNCESEEEAREEMRGILKNLLGQVEEVKS